MRTREGAERWRPQTQALHAGYVIPEGGWSVVPPIYQTAAFEMPGAEVAADIFALRQDGHCYTRITNPTTDVLEQRVAALDGGVGALALASGQAAISLAVLNICHAGDNIVSAADLYGGTWNLFANSLRRMGIETRFVDAVDPESFARATDDRTRCYFGETLPNPRLLPFPIAEVAAIGDRYGVPLIVDNTMAPAICRPIDHGAAIVVYSATKYLGGHGNSIAGIIVDSGRFDWAANAARFPMMTEPDPAHGDVRWLDVVGPIAHTALGRSPYLLKSRMTWLRDLGPCISPFNSFLLLVGLETLAMRMKAHCENAATVAAFLSSHPRVLDVTYPGLMTGRPRAVADAHLTGGYGPLMQFEIEGGEEAARRFIASTELFLHVANVGDSRSLAIHPASTTHAQLPKDDQVAAGVTPGAIRLAIGIEDVEDLLDDLGKALAAS